MKLLALPIGDEFTGSSWFRLYQYFPYLCNEGWDIDVLPYPKPSPDILRQAGCADLVINQKNLFNTHFIKTLRKSSRRLIFDLDDAIYTRSGKSYSWLTQRRINARIRQQIQSADLVITSSKYLRDYVAQYSNKVQVIPMAVDLNKWNPKTKFVDDKIIVGWAGAPHNLMYLERLESTLAILIAKYPQVKVAVFSGQRPNWSLPTLFFPFEKGKEHDFIQSLDIGLLPLIDDPFTRGKSPIKALQYMACAVPVVANVFGATQEILNPDNSIAVQSEKDWVDAIEQLILDKSLRTELGGTGHSFVESRHNMQQIASQLGEVLNTVMN